MSMISLISLCKRNLEGNRDIKFFWFKIGNIGISQHANFREFLTIMILTIIRTHCIAQCVFSRCMYGEKISNLGFLRSLRNHFTPCVYEFVVLLALYT